MISPTCYVIDAASWNAFMESLGWAFLLCMAAVWAASVDWWQISDRWRIHQRRRRIREIRWTREAKRNGVWP